ncbi:Hypothetical predicted protein [Octopus vulgaris]|uniref:Uncharacterized protein n=1 Tax=Octopus vulgaris TaxID=6645 RepID=A0AA36BAK0_OCTVU|nr:Hypothetical predicted protein [Octopus vulgaris]
MKHMKSNLNAGNITRIKSVGSNITNQPYRDHLRGYQSFRTQHKLLKVKMDSLSSILTLVWNLQIRTVLLAKDWKYGESILQYDSNWGLKCTPAIRISRNSCLSIRLMEHSIKANTDFTGNGLDKFKHLTKSLSPRTILAFFDINVTVMRLTMIEWMR